VSRRALGRISLRGLPLATIALLLVSVGALAYWAATGIGSGGASVGTLAAPSITSATPGSNSVALSWSAVAAPGSGTVSYYVKRDGGAASAGCPSASSPSTVTSCTDTGVSSGSHQYTVTAVWRSWTRTSTSASVTVAAQATQLVFTTQPAGATGGTAFTTQPVVKALDANGNVVPGYSGTVTLSIFNNTGTAGAALSGCSGSRVNGVTTFSGCRIDKVGTGYKLRASDGTFNANSTAFDVTVGPAARFVLAAATATPTAGAADNLSITAQDAGGNTATGYTGAHSLTFSGASTSPSGAQPTVTNSSGTAVAFGTATSISFTSGVATVSGSANGAMVLRKAGAATITVTDGTASTATGLAVTVSTGAAARLAWTHVTQSAGTLSSPCLFTCTVTAIGNNGTLTANVSVTDADGNTVSNLGTGHTVTVTTPATGTGSGGSFTAPAAGTSVTLTIAGSGVADSTAQFTFKAQTGSWTSDTLSTQTATGTVYTAASATASRN
jgi:hypothetical protein